MTESLSPMFNEGAEYADFVKVIQAEIERFSQDAECRTLYLQIREEYQEYTMNLKKERGKIISSGGKAQEKIDRDFLGMFEWISHFWTSRNNFLKIAKLFDLKLIPEIISESEQREYDQMELGRNETYRTSIPYLYVYAYRAHRHKNTEGLKDLTQIKFNFSVNNDDGIEIAIPKEFNIDMDKLQIAMEKRKRLEEQWKREFSNELWRTTSIIKLSKLEAFNDKLLDKCGSRLSNSGFTIMTSSESGFNIVYIKCFGFHKGSNIDWEPLTYEELLDVLYFGEKNVVQKFVGEFTSNWVIPTEWIEEVKIILQEPITDEEYKKIGEIIKEGKKKTISGWVDKATQMAKCNWNSLVNKCNEKAETI